MFIKMLIGRYAGEVRDIDNEVANTLLSQGKAERAFTEPEAALPRPPRKAGRQPWEVVLPAGSRGAKKAAR